MPGSNYNIPAITEGAPVPAAWFDLVADTLGTGLGAALDAVGAGTIGGGEAGTPAGLSLPVSAWEGILPASTTRSGKAGATTSAQSVTAPASASFVVWAVPVAGAYADGTPYDTAQTAQAALQVYLEGDEPDGGTPLIGGTSGPASITATTDRRVASGTSALSAALAALTAKEGDDVALLRSVIGAAYFPPVTVPPTATPAAIADRLAALEGGTTAEDAATFWGLLQRSGTDATTIAAYVQAQLPAAVSPPTPVVLVPDVVATNVLKGLFSEMELGLRLVGGGLMTVADLKADLDTYLDVDYFDPRVNPANYDAVNSTAAIDYATGVIS